MWSSRSSGKPGLSARKGKSVSEFIRKAALASIVASLPVACASWFMVGSEPASGPPASRPQATYRVPECQLSVGRTAIPGPVDQTYYLATGPEGRLVLYELDRSNTGAMITSHWVDAQGDHFFNYVKRQPAWEFIIPQDRVGPAWRLVYKAGTYAVTTEADYVRPASGSPVAFCPMVRTDQPDPLAVAGMAEPSAPAAVATPASANPFWAAPSETPAVALPVARTPPVGQPAPPTQPVGTAAQTPPVGGLCAADADCKGGRTCVSRHCTWRPAVSRCDKDVDCPGELICIDSQCQAPGAPAPPSPDSHARSTGLRKKKAQ